MKSAKVTQGETMISFQGKIDEVYREVDKITGAAVGSFCKAEARDDRLTDAMVEIESHLDAMALLYTQQIQVRTGVKFSERERLAIRAGVWNHVLMMQLYSLNESIVEPLADLDKEAAIELRYALFHDMPCQIDIDD